MYTVKTTSRGLKVTVTGGHFSRQSFYATRQGLRFAPGARVLPPAVVFGLLRKGEARQVRKALRAAGRPDLARCRRDEEAALASLDAAALALIDPEAA